MEFMTIEEMQKHEWVVPWSGGKDSTATIIMMLNYGVPIKKVTYCRMMYSDNIPATLPIMTNFVDATIEKFKKRGINVDVVKSIKTAEECENAVFFRSKKEYRNGYKYGIYAYARGVCMMSSIKIRTLKKLENKDDFCMIGYAIDETSRIHRLSEKRQSILCTLNITEDDCFKICRDNNMLSPLYDIGIKRDGCFFCPNATKFQREYLKKNNPELVRKIYKSISETIRFEDFKRNNWVLDYLEYLKIEKE